MNSKPTAASPPVDHIVIERWDVHQHRDELQVSDHATIYHPERGQLCQVERHWDVILYHPIRFENRAAAFKWIREGYISEIQESLSNLGVGFSTVAFEDRNRQSR